jgi:hypothetical protein
MLAKILILFLISLPTLAEEICEINSHPELNVLIDVFNDLQNYAATDEQIRNAHCLKPSPFTKDEMLQWLKDNQSAPVNTQSINGITFENESQENLDSFKHLTTPLGDWSLKYTSQCKKVECAVKEIFGPELGIQLLFMQSRFGMNGSHLIHNDDVASSWKKEELDEILLALTDFPQGIFPIEKSRTLIHAPRGKKSGATVANPEIQIFDNWNKLSPERRRSAVVHELGHVVDGYFQNSKNASWMSGRDKWLSQSDWKMRIVSEMGVNRRKMSPGKPETIVSEYGTEDEKEDLAESVVAYRYNPKSLKEKSPAKYAIIKEVIFDNVEYTSAEACSSPKRLSAELKAQVEKDLNSWQPSEEDLKLISNRCTPFVINSWAQNASISFDSEVFQSCYERAVKAHSRELMEKKLIGKENAEFLAPMVKNTKLNFSPEKLSALKSSAKAFHMEKIKDRFSQSAVSDLDCTSLEANPITLGYTEEVLGIKSQDSTLKKQFNIIAKRVCDEGKSSKRQKYLDSKFK